ncbi:MAG: hypothetical protein MJZ56_04570 [Bacteroidales bacterium]|nr:hypothetical protein [Bacteroidales bacterium]
MKLSTKILSVIAVFVCLSACKEHSNTDVIDEMQARLEKAEKEIDKTRQNVFLPLIDMYAQLDTTIARERDIHEQMELVQAYLQQFETEYPNFKREAEFTKNQLENLKSDILSNDIEEEKGAEYIAEEEKHVKQLENQIDYFNDRLQRQSQIVKKLLKK